LKTLGRLEHVLIRRDVNAKWQPFDAKIDTGAFWSRIGAKEAARLRLGPISDVRTITTSNGGKERRVLVPAKLRIAGIRIAAHFTVSPRKSGVLIGRRTLGKRFRVSPSRRYLNVP
jgi:hypothetical protein